MNIFHTHRRIVAEYKRYLESFIHVQDELIAAHIQEALDAGKLFPDPLIQFNPSFAYGPSLAELVAEGLLHRTLDDIFRGYSLYQHQVDALRLGTSGQDFIVTSGTGSGKSLTYIAAIFDRILRAHDDGSYRKGVKAVIVYPMNALINSQTEEFRKYQRNYLEPLAPASLDREGLAKLPLDEQVAELERATGATFPISFAQYTGQEGEAVRDRVKADPPDIILTNYMMLELMMTRLAEAPLRDSFRASLDFLVFDELHTYRGRQGSDVAMLIRRIQAFTGRPTQCIGTSATMSSGGDSLDAQKETVAEVGQLIFGKPFGKTQVVNETLTRVTAYRDVVPSREELSLSLDPQSMIDGDETQLRNHPLALWLEAEIGLEQISPKWLRRRTPVTMEHVYEVLAEAARVTADEAEAAIKALLAWSEKINEQLKSRGIRRAYFPFRLHQFISQTGGVYVTLDPPETRNITLEAGYFIQGKNADRQRLYQIVFSRVSGHEFICVRKKISDRLLYARDFNDYTDDPEEEDLIAGYLIPDNEDDPIWRDEFAEQLPTAWIRRYKDGVTRVIPKYRARIPNAIYYNADGRFGESPDGIPDAQFGWFMPTKLLFDPTSGVFFDAKSSEGSKLMRLGNEGRSTATTTLSLAAVDALRLGGLPDGDQKLLSFTDNRQDASLQAGHFNDFVSIGRIRSAIYHALRFAPDHMLGVDHIAAAVVRALALEQEEYAQVPARFAGKRAENESALQDYLTIRVLQDLKRGWRYTMPNLEQCGLLDIGYRYIEAELDTDIWTELPLPIVAQMSVDERRTFFTQTLDYIRTSNAIYHRYFVEDQVTVANAIKNKLTGAWTLGEQERLESPNYMRYQSVGRVRRTHTASMGKASNWGRYVSQIHQHQTGESLSQKDFEGFAERLLDLLSQMGLLRAKAIQGETGETTAYILDANAIEWRLGKGETVRPDLVRRRSYLGDAPTPAPNTYFEEFYRRDFTVRKDLVAAEHTGQVQHQDRIDREERFRAGTIRALYCSPTMELGIDIANLNIVHLRNVPPNPANYAQRSGRAGRSGQGALVITYCSQLSAHDRHYFQHPAEMVAGVVVAPRLNLDNEELLRSHIQATYLLESGINITKSVTEVIDLEDEQLGLNADTKHKLQAGHRARSEKVVHLFTDILQRDKVLAGVLSPKQLAAIVDECPQNFDRAFNRWRELYRNTLRLADDAHRIKTGSLYAADSDERKQANINARVAYKQLEELKNDYERYTGTLSEFYPFRYLASEGFLPGYNFTRLPIRAAINGYESAQFLSRPRLLALQEFGPRNIIYHNGQSYEIDRLNITDVEGQRVSAKVARTSGYILMGDEFNRETDPINPNVNLNSGGGTILTNLIEMRETGTRVLNRITSEEEERRRTGYVIETYFSLPQGRAGCDTIYVKSAGETLLEILYMPTANIVQVNKSERRTEREQFLIDKTYGYWKRDTDADNDDKGRIIPVSLYTSITTNALYIQPTAKLGLEEDQVITLKYAFKRAIEERYQVEGNEIGVTLMGDGQVANIMLYESSEGSLGVLSQLVASPQEFQALVRRAYELCYFDKGEDLKPELGPATYNDLLSYYNQRDHEVIDRHRIKEPLEDLMKTTIEIGGRGTVGDYDAQYKHLLANYDESSSTERQFLDGLYKLGLRLPDEAQPSLKDVEGLYVTPDFRYDRHVYVFCDGTPHDREDVRADDHRKRRALRDRGLRSIIYHYRDSLDDLVKANADVFTSVK